MCIALSACAQVGYPSDERVFVFNGDFVDRGRHGTEVLLTLLAAKTAFPATVFLNRGNHEDRHICQAYGFHQEVCVLAVGLELLYMSLC